MIGKLRGLVDEIDDDSVLLDVGGVGYVVFCSQRTLAALPAPGEMAQLVVEMIVREDAHQLYGFPDTVEREWFRLLTTVQRVGNKVALQIMSAYTPQQMAHAILAKDTAAFSRIKGIGSGLAERIVTELKDKVAKLPVDGLALAEDSGQKKKKNLSDSRPALRQLSSTDDAISALVNLGYSRTQAYGAVLKANEGGVSGLDELIKTSLKELVRG